MIDGLSERNGVPRAKIPRSPARRLNGTLVQHLGMAIVSGRYHSGALLTKQAEASETLDVSRGAYREAVQILASKGLVESRPRAGTRVTERHRWNVLDPDVLAWSFLGQPDMDYVQQLFELRAIVEPQAARLAALRRTKTDIRRLGDCLTAMRRHSSASEEGRTAERQFHHAILDATYNDALKSLSPGIVAAANSMTHYRQQQDRALHNPVPDYARIFDAIVAGDGRKAMDAMRDLIDAMPIDLMDQPDRDR